MFRPPGDQFSEPMRALDACAAFTSCVRLADKRAASAACFGYRLPPCAFLPRASIILNKRLAPHLLSSSLPLCLATFKTAYTLCGCNPPLSPCSTK